MMRNSVKFMLLKRQNMLIPMLLGMESRGRKCNLLVQIGLAVGLAVDCSMASCMGDMLAVFW